MAGAHSLAVEAVAQAVSNREWVVADVPVEREVDPAAHALGSADLCRKELVANGPRDIAQSRSPCQGFVAGQDEHGLDQSRESLLETGDDAAVDKDPGRKRVRQHDPDLVAHDAVRAPSAATMRSASDAPSRPW